MGKDSFTPRAYEPNVHEEGILSYKGSTFRMNFPKLHARFMGLSVEELNEALATEVPETLQLQLPVLTEDKMNLEALVNLYPLVYNICMLGKLIAEKRQDINFNYWN